ncbi:MAG: PEP-CTERM sorting domain-containing protein [Sedimentisphaerales bacterium]|nr:PEP-CTERM sorting domain-containing protein [Sedimentisphaerales bacterium]
MKGKFVSKVWLVFLAGFVNTVLFGSIADAIVIEDLGCSSEYYLLTQSPNKGRLQGVEFDSNGNLYLSYRGTDEVINDGILYQIKPDKTCDVFAVGLYSPENIVWGGGTSYGEYLYVADVGEGVVRVNMSGGVSHFSNSNQPIALGLDRYGNYGNLLYSSTAALDHMDKIYLNGSSQKFSDFPYNIGGGSAKSIDFDPGTRYNGKMYVGTYSQSTPEWSGVFGVDTSGNPSRFTNDIVGVLEVEFDKSGQYFGGDMFVLGMSEFGSVWSLYRVDDLGNATLFAHESGVSSLGPHTFGPDGALYIAKDYGGWLSITRVVPEPMSLVLVGLGAIGLMRRRRR